jgi:hypothetical protein
MLRNKSTAVSRVFEIAEGSDRGNGQLPDHLINRPRQAPEPGRSFPAKEYESLVSNDSFVKITERRH